MEEKNRELFKEILGCFYWRRRNFDHMSISPAIKTDSLGENLDDSLWYLEYRVDRIIDRINLMNEIETAFMTEYVKRSKLVDSLITPQVKIFDYLDTDCKHNRIVDFLVEGPNKWLVVEVNGHEYHTGLKNEIKDHERDIEITRAGLEVVYFTGKDVFYDCDSCVDLVLDKIGSKKYE